MLVSGVHSILKGGAAKVRTNGTRTTRTLYVVLGSRGGPEEEVAETSNRIALTSTTRRGVSEATPHTAASAASGPSRE